MEFTINVLSVRVVRFTDEKSGEVIEGSSVYYVIPSDNPEGDIPAKTFVKGRKSIPVGEQVVKMEVVGTSKGTTLKPTW